MAEPAGLTRNKGAERHDRSGSSEVTAPFTKAGTRSAGGHNVSHPTDDVGLVVPTFRAYIPGHLFGPGQCDAKRRIRRSALAGGPAVRELQRQRWVICGGDDLKKRRAGQVRPIGRFHDLRFGGLPVDLSEVEDAFHRLDSKFFELSEQALVVEPHPRIRALRAAAARPFMLPVDPSGELAVAEALARQPADQSLVCAVQVLVQQGPRAAVTPLVSHTEAFPDDLVAVFFRTYALLLSGERGARDRALTLLEADAGVHRGDWRWDGPFAMVRQEQRRYDEARDLAASALESEPRAGNAVHVLAHVNYETGEHAAGLRWLDEWREHHTVAAYQQHFVWHTTLHLLAMGDLNGVLSRYGEGIGPDDPIDAGTLLWRCRLAGAGVRDLGRQAAVGAQPILESLPAAFPVFNICSRAGRRRGRGGPWSALCPFGGGRETCLCGSRRSDSQGADGSSSRDGMAIRPPSCWACWTIYRESVVAMPNAKCVEDTLVFALVEDGRVGEARSILENRLRRRPHAIDGNLLAKATR